MGEKNWISLRKLLLKTKWPLLGGTLVGIIAFAPIGFAPGDTAEYTGHLFWVILISLMFSWFFAITLTPMFCYGLFKESSNANTPQSEKTENAFYRGYRQLVKQSLRLRGFIAIAALALFIVSIWGFQFVKSGFFSIINHSANGSGLLATTRYIN